MFFKKSALNRELLFVFCFGLGVGIVIILTRAGEFLYYFNYYILEHRGLATTFPFWQIPKMKGLFVEPSALHLLSLFIIPFTIFGFLYPKVWGQYFKVREFSSGLLIFFYTMFLGLLFLISFPFIYQHRFLIIFDFFLIIFAVPSMLILVNYFLRDKSGRVLIGIFLLIFSLRVGVASWAQGPQLFQEELKEIKAFSSDKEPKTIIATNSLYTPWLYGFSGHTVIGPGWHRDKWDLSMWMEFWVNGNDARRHELLSLYNSVMYFYVGERQPTNQPYYKFIQSDPHFTEISPHIWKYNPDL